MMLKSPIGEAIHNNKHNASIILATDLTNAVDGAHLIPIDCGGKLLTPIVSVNELGKLLLKAAAEGNVQDVGALLGKGALFTADWLGTSPLHLAAKNDHLEVLELLLQAGISKDARTKVDKTSLHMAAAEGHLNIVEMLLEYGADAECKDMLGMTPLHWAVQNGHVNTVRSLLKYCGQIDSINKFELTPLDIAVQINRQDIVDLINAEFYELADGSGITSNLVEQKAETIEINSTSNSPIPLETILMEDTENSIDPERLHLNKAPNAIINTENQEGAFADSMRLLQAHGITMLPNDDSNILTTVMETGHSVVLTDAGKQILNSFKESEEKVSDTFNKKIITLTQEEFLAMTGQSKKSESRILPKNFKRIVMKNNKLVSVSNSGFKLSGKCNNPTDMETVMSQLIEARKTIEEYKVKLYKKEQEAERYKKQLKLLLDQS